MKRVDEIPTIYAKTNTNQKKCDLVEDLGGNKYQICRESQKTITIGFNKPSKPTFVVDSIDMFNIKPIEIQQFVKPLDYSPYNNLSTSYQPRGANLAIKACNDENSFNYLKQQTKFDHSNQKLGDNEIKHIANVVKTGELPNLRILDLHGNDFGLEGMFALFDMMQSPNVKSLSVILCSSNECKETVNFFDKMTNYYIAEFAKRNQLPETYVVSDQACLKTLSMTGSNIFSGLMKCPQLIFKGNIPYKWSDIIGRGIMVFSCSKEEFLDPNFIQESVGCVTKINDFLDSFFQKKNEVLNQNTLLQKKETIEPQQVIQPLKKTFVQPLTKPLTQADKERLAVNPRLGIRYDKNGNSMEDFIKSWHDAKNKPIIQATEETQRIRDQLQLDIDMARARGVPESVRNEMLAQLRQMPRYYGPMKPQVEQPPSNTNTNRSKKDECIIF
jgi:hypothetical protein